MSPEFGPSWSNRLAEAPIMWLVCMLLIGGVLLAINALDKAIP